ncbi:hypothetical protein [Enterococcus sp. HY326]|uniref:hypothetical protein n=1 Tax=Enterococcus sp. HY326 TaxID=2971265 RepID=UPI00223F7812|nr:hypothetical protein [Enterococcus sp. HY326]
MTIFFSICIGLSIGVIVGFFSGVITRKQKSKAQKTSKLLTLMPQLKKANPYIIMAAFLLLGIGLIWTVYYLVLGILDPVQTGYATNVSQLIVSVLTVFSIIVAFIQFLTEKK